MSALAARTGAINLGQGFPDTDGPAEVIEAAGFDVLRPAGTYFAGIDVSALGEDDGHAFCLTLPERAGVVAVPMVVFYDDKQAGRSLVRFAFCKRDEVIDEAAARLSRLQG
jgi:N-succinyldiaminopimelate aminotransferase